MKRLYYLILLALPIVFAASCDDDNNLPDVDVSMSIDGAVNIDGTLYAVQGDTIKINGITVTNNEEGKSAIITSATYSWDYRVIGVSVTPPYGANIATNNVPLGAHLLQVECPLYAVDKSPSIMFFGYKVVVVPSADDIPSGEQQTNFMVKPGIKES